MKLIYVTSSLPYGSGEAFIIPEIEELIAQGHEVWVVPMYPRGDIVHKEVLRFIDRVVTQPLFSKQVLLEAMRQFFCSPVRAIKALTLVFTWNPRLLLKNLAVYPKGLWLAELAQRLGADHIHAHWAATTASMAMVASKASGIPWSLTAHRWDVIENNLLRRKALHARFFRCISRKTLEMAVKRGVPENKAFILYSGIRLYDKANTCQESNISEKPFVILCPAALILRKGHQYLLEALSNLPPQIHVWLAGDGPLRSLLEDFVNKKGLTERVYFLGQLPHQELLRLYQQCEVDIVVLPSVNLKDEPSEGIPVALIEAMSFCIPVIATETGGIPELLEGGAGLLVPQKDPKALAEAIASLASDPNLRRALGEKGRERVEKEFSVEVVAHRLAELFAGGE